MGRTIYVVDIDDARAALDQIKAEAIADGGEDGGRIAALPGSLAYSSTERTSRATSRVSSSKRLISITPPANCSSRCWSSIQ
jgi:hypothetical protein